MVTLWLLQALLAAIWPQTPVPGYRAHATLVELDVVVTDATGRPARGLRREDFTVAEDGAPVEIATFTAVDLPDASPTTLPRPDRSGSAFASNEHGADGRLLLIVLDDLQVSTSAGRMATVKSIARRAVERLGPSDLGGLMTSSGARDGQVAFTTDKRRLLEGIERFQPRGERELPAIARTPSSIRDATDNTEGLAVQKTASTMAGLRDAASTLATISHRRKAVLLVSQGLPATIDEIIRDPKGGAAWDAIREFVVTAQRSNVAVYTADPCGLDRDPACTSDSRQHLRAIAERTGGFAMVDGVAREAAVDRMLAENGTYYLIGYYSPADPAERRHHRVAVRTRAGLEVRTREGYDSPGPARQAPSVAPLDALTAGLLQTPGLTMRVVAIPAPLETAPSATVIVGIELPAAAARSARKVDFTIVAIDQDGKARARVRFATDFSTAAATGSPWLRTGSRIDVPPGRYQIRVAAIGADAAQGSVFTEATVPRFDAGLGVGGLSLGAPMAAAGAEGDRLRRAMPVVPFAVNEVAADGAVAAQLPIRVASKSGAERLTITAALTRADGARSVIDRTDAAGRDYAGPAGRIYQVRLPQGLDAGAYRVEVEVRLGGTTVAREVDFSMLPSRARPRP